MQGRDKNMLDVSDKIAAFKAIKAIVVGGRYRCGRKM